MFNHVTACHSCRCSSSWAAAEWCLTSCFSARVPGTSAVFNVGRHCFVGYHDTQPPQLVNSRPGEGGFSLHGGPYTNPLPSFHTVGPFGGRCHTEQVNLGWQLDATAADDGGFQVLLGSHVGNYPLPWEDKNSIDHPLCVPTPAPAGSVVFFMGGAVIHGVAAWTGKTNRERRAFLCFYQSRFTGYPVGNFDEGYNEFVKAQGASDARCLAKPRL